MSQQDTFADVQQSFQRCLTRKEFLHRFYEIFMASHPALPRLFARTHFDTQIRLLRHGLSASIAYAGGTRVGAHVLERIGDTHSRGKMNIDPRLYPFWIDSLVQAVAETDPRYDEPLGDRWRDALRIAIDFIREVR